MEKLGDVGEGEEYINKYEQDGKGQNELESDEDILFLTHIFRSATGRK